MNLTPAQKSMLFKAIITFAITVAAVFGIDATVINLGV